MSAEHYQMLAKTFDGLEEVLKTELEELGASDVEVVTRGVKFSGSKELLYRANFCCRTALRILRIIGEIKVKSTNDLYQGVYKLPWEDFFDVNQTFAINSTVNSEAFNNSMFVSLKTKDAIVDRFRSKFDKRPSVNTDNPDFRINVHASADMVTLSLDSSGESLHKRGYRVGQNEASMSEVLAAGLLKIAGWNGQCDFYDTMCGSGTIPIEAALIARNIPPGIFRQEFAFESWKDFDQDLLEKVYNDDYERSFEHKIFATDFSALSIKVAEKNAKSAGVLKSIEFGEKDFAGYEPQPAGGMLIINPPYGERMNSRKVEPIYNMIGDQLKRNFQGFKAWVFSSSEEGFKSIGLKPSEKIPLQNGPLSCSFRLYEVYEGSKKVLNQDGYERRSNEDSSSRPAFRRRENTVSDRRSQPDGNRRSAERPSFRSKPGNDDRQQRSGGFKSHDDRPQRNSGTARRDDRSPGSSAPGRRDDRPQRAGGFDRRDDRPQRSSSSGRHDDRPQRSSSFGRQDDRQPRGSGPGRRDDRPQRDHRAGDDDRSTRTPGRFTQNEKPVRPRENDQEMTKRREAFYADRRSKLEQGMQEKSKEMKDKSQEAKSGKAPKSDHSSSERPKRPRIK